MSSRPRPPCASCWPARSVPSGRVGRDGVAVLTPLEMRGLSFHTVVFTGLAEGGFPARGRPDPILGDGERRRVAEARWACGCRWPSSATPSRCSLFAFACEAARERLVLLAPRTDAATRASAPAVAPAPETGVAGRRPAGRARRVPQRQGAGAGLVTPGRRRAAQRRRQTPSGSTSASATPRSCSTCRGAAVARARQRVSVGSARQTAARPSAVSAPGAPLATRSRARGTGCSASKPAPRWRRGTRSTPRCIPRASSATSAVRSPSCCATCSGSMRPTSRATRSRSTRASSAPWRTPSCSWSTSA